MRFELIKFIMPTYIISNGFAKKNYNVENLFINLLVKTPLARYFCLIFQMFFLSPSPPEAKDIQFLACHLDSLQFHKRVNYIIVVRLFSCFMFFSLQIACEMGHSSWLPHLSFV